MKRTRIHYHLYISRSCLQLIQCQFSSSMVLRKQYFTNMTIPLKDGSPPWSFVYIEHLRDNCSTPACLTMSCNILEAALKVVPFVFVGKPSPCGEAFNPLNAKIVAANFSCSAKVVFVKEKRWLCQSIEAPCNALVNVLRLYSNVYRLLTTII